MGIINALKGAARGLVVGDNAMREKFTNEATLQQMFDSANAENLVPGTVYRLHSTGDGHCVGFLVVCSCGHTYPLLGQLECLRLYTCGICKVQFRISDKVGITVNGVIKSELTDVSSWEGMFAKLKSRPHFTTAARAPFISTWPEQDDDNWDGKPPLGSDGGWV